MKRTLFAAPTLFDGYEDRDLVFAQPDGTPVHPDRFSKVFRSLVADAGLPQIRLHDLRHTHATLALNAGVHPKVVSERLGHASVGITLDTYSHVMPSLQQEAADVVADSIFGSR
ncbi:MAG: site-specific integrase [Acidimicrobiia bacterium]|nr:site-specific integrase [Acidimicrobiia bacterium]